MLRSSIRIGRVGGIPVGVHWSLLVVGVALTATLATGLLPAAVESPTGTRWIAGAVGAVLFFGSVLVHELAHSLVARRRGVEVEEITLWILGGLARLRSEAPTARAHLAIAVAGPAASLVAAAGFTSLALVVDVLGLGDVARVTLVWLALVNGVLAVFNLLPGAPLDGGRVLAALLWMRHGDRTRALVTAARAGRVVGWVLVALGVSNFATGVGFGTLWTALVGWFVVEASAGEESAARVRRRLEGRTVAEVMNPHPPVVPEWVTVDEAQRSGLPGGARVALLSRFPEGDISGLITRERLRNARRLDRAEQRLRDIGFAKHELTTVAPSDLASAHFEAAVRAPLVVLESGRVVGVLGIDELSSLARADRLVQGRAAAR